MAFATDISTKIGNTPLLALDSFSKAHGLETPVLAKLESFNPLSSIKDRLALALIEDAEERGLLKPGGVIIEPTSGNTGIGLAFLAARRGYRLILTMPETMSVERRKILAALGAELVLTPGAQGMTGAVGKAEELLACTQGAYGPRQFDNPAGPACHERTTAAEILRDTGGDIGAFVCCVGTGGTITGVARALKRHNPDILIAAVEPDASPVLSGGMPGPHRIQGIGAGFVPGVLDVSLIDEVIRVTDNDALKYTKELGRAEGLLVGISSGAAACAAAAFAKKHPGKRVVTVFPDTGERYLGSL